jgi:hypothetical protein
MSFIEFIDTASDHTNHKYLAGNAKWPDFDFRKLPLRDASRKQLAGIYENVRKSGNVPAGKLALTKLIVNNAYLPHKGLYLPISDYVSLTGKLPTFSEQLALTGSPLPGAAFPTQYFTNPLLIPSGYGTLTFDVGSADKPKMRVSNGGFLVVTMEV